MTNRREIFGKRRRPPCPLPGAAQGDAAIKPGQFQEFEVSHGALPETDQMISKALQTYSGKAD